jgi:hypothetical protein
MFLVELECTSFLNKRELIRWNNNQYQIIDVARKQNTTLDHRNFQIRAPIPRPGTSNPHSGVWFSHFTNFAHGWAGATTGPLGVKFFLRKIFYSIHLLILFTSIFE